MGIPDMKKYWNDLCKKAETNKFGNDKKLFKKMASFICQLTVFKFLN
ncbi:hypothetical protein GMMP15_1510029 [Candidatus Magnetomoraceae bacterium gMMP-15]